MAQGYTVNSIFLSGNLTRNPVVKFLKSGTAVTNLGLAVNNRKKVGEEWVDDTCFIDVTLYGKNAEQAGETLDKGMPVFVEGRLQYRSWEAPDGSKRSKHEVVADIVKPLVKFQKDGSKSSGRSEDDDEFADHPARGRQMPRRDSDPTPDDSVPF